MKKQGEEAPGSVSWKLFESLYHNQDEFIDKVEYIVKTVPDEEYHIGVSMIEDMVAINKKGLEKFWQEGNAEKKAPGSPTSEPTEG